MNNQIKIPFLVISTIALLAGTSLKLKWEKLYIIHSLLFIIRYHCPCLSNDFYTPKTYTSNFLFNSVMTQSYKQAKSKPNMLSMQCV